MKRYEIQSIEPTEENATVVQQVLYDDFARLESMTAEQARTIANPDDETMVARQLAKLEANPSEYFSYHEGTSNDFVAIARVGDWLYGDNAPFVSPFASRLARGKHQAGLNKHNTAGLHGFARVEGLSPRDYEEVTSRFLGSLCVKAMHNERSALVAAVDQEDTSLIEEFEARNPKSRRRLGQLSLGNTTRTYVRLQTPTSNR